MSIRCGLQSLDGVLSCRGQFGSAELHAARFGCRKDNKGTLLFGPAAKRWRMKRSVDGGLFGEDAPKHLTPRPCAGQHGLVDLGLHDPG